MEDTELNEGEVVMLRSGGPEMTYEGDDMAGQAICTWFEKGVKKQTEVFNKKSLVKVG